MTVLDQEVNWDSVPEDFRESCASCGSTKVLSDEEFGERECPECDGRGWTLSPIQNFIDEINMIRDLTVVEPAKKYHGWITVEPDKDGERRYRGRFNKPGSKFKEDIVSNVSYRLDQIIVWMEEQIGQPFEIEEKLEALGGFKVYTYIKEEKNQPGCMCDQGGNKVNLHCPLHGYAQQGGTV